MSTPPLVFITGASSGIGQALAARYAQSGWRLALAARRVGDIEAWARDRGLGAERCVAYAADVQRIDSIAAAGRSCIERQGLPDVVIASAGISVGVDTAERGDLDVMSETFAINNVGMAATFHPFLAAMKQRRSGTLVGIASVAAIRGMPGHGAYCASKAAVVSYCESLRVECRPAGLKVVTLLPGWVATPLTAGNRYRMPFMLEPDDFARRAQRAIAAGASYRVIPWQMGLVVKLLRLLPNPLFDRLFQGKGRKRRRSG
ncbi:MAG TPA: SDR family oxidoreductase [Burkholderiaceae bacterium]|nr:SDR family oxidoreductase [Burkholderiaceae bacterium]